MWWSCILWFDLLVMAWFCLLNTILYCSFIRLTSHFKIYKYKYKWQSLLPLCPSALFINPGLFWLYDAVREILGYEVTNDGDVHFCCWWWSTVLHGCPALRCQKCSVFILCSIMQVLFNTRDRLVGVRMGLCLHTKWVVLIFTISAVDSCVCQLLWREQNQVDLSSLVCLLVTNSFW